MCEHEFKIESMKEKDYTIEQLEYIRQLEKAAEPTRIWIEELVKGCCNYGNQ